MGISVTLPPLTAAVLVPDPDAIPLESSRAEMRRDWEIPADEDAFGPTLGASGNTNVDRRVLPLSDKES